MTRVPRAKDSATFSAASRQMEHRTTRRHHRTRHAAFHRLAQLRKVGLELAESADHFSHR
jgi:hypothetical protein